MYQTLADEPVAHPTGGGALHPEHAGQLRHSLRTAGSQLDQHPILSQGHVLGEVIEGSSGHGNQRAARSQDRIDQLVSPILG